MGHDTWRPGIARRLAEMHAFSLDESIPRTFSSLRTWLEQARDLDFSEDQAARRDQLNLSGALTLLGNLSRHFYEAIKPTAETSAGIRAAIRPVLAHNDLLAGNVLVNESTGAIRFIDYEYSACGYAGFDVANHFCEYAGFDSDFAQHFPVVPHANRSSSPTWAPMPQTPMLPTSTVWCACSCLSTTCGGSWAVIQAVLPIEFDFLTYAELRFAGLRFHRSLVDERPRKASYCAPTTCCRTQKPPSGRGRRGSMGGRRSRAPDTLGRLQATEYRRARPSRSAEILASRASQPRA